MDYQEKSNVKIGVSGAGKNYLKMPWSIEDTIENLEELKEIMQQKLIMTNHHGRGEKDAEEIAFDFDRAIQALKENQEYKKIGTLEEVREAVEKQCEHCGYKIHSDNISKLNSCNDCGMKTVCKKRPDYGDYCRINCYDWSEAEE